MRTRIHPGHDPISLTKQSFKDETNINKIMEKFQRTGAIDHYAKYAPNYDDATSDDLHTSLNIIADANSMFEELPSSIRKKFENNPQKFLDFVQDPKNLEEMRELGLAEKKSPTPKPIKVVMADPPKAKETTTTSKEEPKTEKT